MFNGVCKWYYENGQLKVEGNYKDNKQDGVFKNYFENGELQSDSFFIDGKLNKYFKQYYENGQLQLEINSIDGEPWSFGSDPDNGFCKIFHINGKLSKKLIYKNGEVDSSQCFNENSEEIKCE